MFRVRNIDDLGASPTRPHRQVRKPQKGARPGARPSVSCLATRSYISTKGAVEGEASEGAPNTLTGAHERDRRRRAVGAPVGPGRPRPARKCCAHAEARACALIRLVGLARLARAAPVDGCSG